MALKRPTTIIDDSLKLFVSSAKQRSFQIRYNKTKMKSKINWEGITIKNAGGHH